MVVVVGILATVSILNAASVAAVDRRLCVSFHCHNERRYDTQYTDYE